MIPFTTLTATALPLVRDNIDTDIIIPSREMRSVDKRGLADGLFAGWRYKVMGGREPDPAFVLNRPDYAGARILLAGENVGCGSSREHAVWALAEYGFRAVVAPSFNPIFRGNCVRNGVVPAQLDADVVRAIARRVEADPAGRPVTVDLVAMRVSVDGLPDQPFVLEEDARAMLLNGWDAIDVTLQHAAAIAAFRETDRVRRPWIYLDK